MPQLKRYNQNMRTEEYSTDETYYLLLPFLNEIQDKLYFQLSHNLYNGDFSIICKNLNITEEEGENIIEEIKTIQDKHFLEI